MSFLAGVDIGGTKCAVCIARVQGNDVELLKKYRFPTPTKPEAALDEIIAGLARLQSEINPRSIEAIGVSCGGPLDSQRGLILSPPNLPNWDRIDVLSPLRNQFNVQAGLQNDANACALAEWLWGAGHGYRNLIFLTFGTGMGAGLILNSQLYVGTNDLAGEVGHIRLERNGPVGYGKPGSFEGFCSGGGIAQMAKEMAAVQIKLNNPPAYCLSLQELPNVTAESVGQAAQQGDPLALEVYHIVGRQLGRGLAFLVDILNPERIIIGSIYARQQSLLEPIVIQALREEALPLSLTVCSIVPTGLGERVGDLAAISVAQSVLHNQL